MPDLLVVGLDLSTGREVHVLDRTIAEWRRKGHNGDRTLVCLACYQGHDLLGGPRRVALVPKGRIGGAKRAHFAHPPGFAPPGGQHHPETCWHSESKAALQQWAAAQPSVTTAIVEAYTDDGRRRSDIAITLDSGDRVAIEVQQGRITDAEWCDRHADYARNNITDIWLWHPSTGIPEVIYDNGQYGWLYDLSSNQIGVAVAQGHRYADGWWEDELLDRYAAHCPPCSNDRVEIRWFPLKEIQLLGPQFELPTQLIAELKQAAATVADSARRARTAKPYLRYPRTPTPTTQRRTHPNAGAGPMDRNSQIEAAIARHLPDGLKSAGRPTNQVRNESISHPVCEICHERLDPILAEYGRHLLCTDGT